MESRVVQSQPSANSLGNHVFSKRNLGELVTAVLILLAAGFWIYIRVREVLPTVFGDELVYQSMSYSDNNQSYLGNGFFTFVYGFTAQFGLESYAYIKALNVAFVSIFGIAVYVYSRKHLSWTASVLISVAGVVSPLSVYSSFFMPEAMFLAFIGLFFTSFSFYMQNENGRGLASLFFVALFLGLASTIKPHALFVLPVVLIYLVWASKGYRASWSHPLLFVAILSLVNIGVTSLAAPAGSIPFFGDYLAGVFDFVGGLASEPATNDSIAVTASAGTPEAQVDLIAVLTSQLGLNLLAGIAFAGVPLGVLIADWLSHKKLPPFSLAIFSFFVLVVALFTTYVTLTGDDHSDRLLLRYYEWILIFLFIDAIVLMTREEDKIPGLRRIIGIAGMAQIAAAVLLANLPVDFQVSDSIFGTGLGKSLDAPYLLAMSVGIFVYLIVRQYVKSPRGLIGLTLVLFASLGFSSQQNQIDVNSIYTGSDYAGVYLFENAQKFETKEIAIVGGNWTLNQAAKFWSRLHEADLYTVEPGSVIQVSDSETPKIVVTLEGITLEQTERVQKIHEGDAFQIYEIAQ